MSKCDGCTLRESHCRECAQEMEGEREDFRKKWSEILDISHKRLLAVHDEEQMKELYKGQVSHAKSRIEEIERERDEVRAKLSAAGSRFGSTQTIPWEERHSDPSGMYVPEAQLGGMRRERDEAREKLFDRTMAAKKSGYEDGKREGATAQAVMVEALKAAQHDLDTSEGLYCTDLEKDMGSFDHAFGMKHRSRAQVDNALANLDPAVERIQKIVKAAEALAGRAKDLSDGLHSPSGCETYYNEAALVYLDEALAGYDKAVGEKEETDAVAPG